MDCVEMINRLYHWNNIVTFLTLVIILQQQAATSLTLNSDCNNNIYNWSQIYSRHVLRGELSTHTIVVWSVLLTSNIQTLVLYFFAIQFRNSTIMSTINNQYGQTKTYISIFYFSNLYLLFFTDFTEVREYLDMFKEYYLPYSTVFSMEELSHK